MEKIVNEDNPESLPNGISEIPGEPALVIDGVPSVCISDGSLFNCETVSDIESSHKSVCFGEWLEGREVQKLFGEQFYNGKVTEFDKKSGWYRVVYEDGDFEDMEWNELQEVLLPLDITIPLKTLASKVIKKRQKHIKKSVKSISRSKNQHLKHIGHKEGVQSLEATNPQSEEPNLLG